MSKNTLNPRSIHNLQQLARSLMAAGVYRASSYGQKYLKQKAAVNNQVRSYKSTRRRKYYKKKKSHRRCDNKVKAVNKRVTKISRKVNKNLSTHIYRLRSTNSLIASANEQNSRSDSLLYDAVMDNAIAALRFFDPSNPTTLITSDLGTSTYAQDISFTKSVATMTIRNNYQVPCYVRAYICIPKVDTSLTPHSTWTSGLADQGNPSVVFPKLFLTDSQLFHDIWKIDSSQKILLEPGQQVVLSYASPRQFEYDPSLVDSHPSTYMKKFFACASFVQVTGVVAHDTALDEQGAIGSGVDILMDITFRIEYNSGGAALHDITVSDTSNSFTNGAVCSNKPVADNQGYSLA